MSTIITGATGGIGRAFALLDETCVWHSPLVLVARDKTKLELLAEEVQGCGGIADFVSGDVGDPNTASRAIHLAKKMSQGNEKITSLVCCSGIGRSGPTESFDGGDFANIMRTNVSGAFNFIRACLPEMLENKDGRIVLMSSVAGVRGYSRNLAYTAANHALVGMASSLAKEHGKRGIVAIPICPGFVDTEMTDRTIAGLIKYRGMDKEDAIKLVASKNPQNRILNPKEVAQAISFALSDAARSLSGNPMILSGGE